MIRRIADKSVLWKALQLKCQLLTGDKSLRNEAVEIGLVVHGCIWVMMKTLAAKLLSAEYGIELFAKLKIVNDNLLKLKLKS